MSSPHVRRSPLRPATRAFNLSMVALVRRRSSPTFSLVWRHASSSTATCETGSHPSDDTPEINCSLLRCRIRDDDCQDTLGEPFARYVGEAVHTSVARAFAPSHLHYKICEALYDCQSKSKGTTYYLVHWHQLLLVRRRQGDPSGGAKRGASQGACPSPAIYHGRRLINTAKL